MLRTMKVGQTTRKWIIGTHILFAGLWVGAALCMLLIQFVLEPDAGGDEIAAYTTAVKLIDDFIIIPAAMGSLLTGLLTSTLLGWGFFRHRWVAVKWAITVTAIIFGTFWLGPWTNGMAEIADKLRHLAPAHVTFRHDYLMNAIFGSLQLGVLVFTVFISTFRPWGSSRSS